MIIGRNTIVFIVKSAVNNFIHYQSRTTKILVWDHMKCPQFYFSGSSLWREFDTCISLLSRTSRTSLTKQVLIFGGSHWQFKRKIRREKIREESKTSRNGATDES